MYVYMDPIKNHIYPIWVHSNFRIASNGQNIRGFRGREHGTTNILATNEATLPTFTWSASSNHEYKHHELINIAEPRIV